MSTLGTTRKRKYEDTDPDVFPGSDEEGGEYADPTDTPHEERRGKRDRTGGGGLQTFTKYVCEKLEQVHEMSNADIAEILVREHSTGDAKKNDNIRRRVYDALSVVNAIGLAEKNGKMYRWVGRPTLPTTANSLPELSKYGKAMADKRKMLIQLICRTVGLEYIRLLNSTRSNGGNTLSQQTDLDELGEFSLPLLLLATNSSSKMIMETDSQNKEIYIKVNQAYTLKSTDSILTELGYDDFSKLDRTVANSLLQVFIAAHIPKDIIEEALHITISDTDFENISTMFASSNQIPPPQLLRSDTEPLSPMTARGLDAIAKAAQQLESQSLRLPSLSQPNSINI